MIFFLLSIVFAYKELGYSPELVKNDIRNILENEEADDGNYGPFLIRLAWHCAGTYRNTDGRGGCDGARIRFDVERSWDDNKGLIPGPHHDLETITALELLYPIKKKYGRVLSWGDLIVLAGNTAIEEMDGPQMDFCGGRVDAYEGYSLEELDVSMIYVNAGNTSADDVREKFEKMDMNDQETIALIGGGHAFGRCHAQYSGFDGAWTTNPITFNNEYFNFLLSQSYSESQSIPGQFETNVGGNTYIMLHADIVLLDDASYRSHIEVYANDMDALLTDFKAAWEKLMNRDMGLRPCAGDIPQIVETGVDYDAVKNDVLAILPDNNPNSEVNHGTWGPLMVRLAWHCSGTYRSTDHIGGCNGARIRHDPELNWGSNADVDLALNRLEPIYDRYQPGLSWADLIIIAGTASLESMGALPMPFCPGRTDVNAPTAAQQSKNLDPEIYLEPQSATAPLLRESMKIMGFTDREMVVLNGGGHAIGQCHAMRSGFEGPWTFTPTQFDNGFFILLLEEEWLQTTSSMGKKQFHDERTRSLTMLVTDLLFRDDDKWRAIVEEYAEDNDLFLEDFRNAWIKLVNADRFGDVCVTSEDNIETTTMVESTSTSTSASPDSNTPIVLPEGDTDLPKGESSTSHGSVTINCNSKKENSETSTIEWVFIITLIILVVLLLCLTYVLSQKITEDKTDFKEAGEYMSPLSMNNKISDWSIKHDGKSERFEDASSQKRLPDISKRLSMGGGSISNPKIEMETKA